MVHLLGIGCRTLTISTQYQRPLGCGIYLTIGAIKWSEQKQATVKASGIARRRNGHVKRRAWTGKRRQVGSHENCRHILHDDIARWKLHSHVLQDVAQHLGGKDGLL